MKPISSSLEQVGLLSEDFVGCVPCSCQLSRFTDTGVNSLVQGMANLS